MSHKIYIVGILLFVTITYLFLSGQNNDIDSDQKRVDYLEAQVIPYIKSNDIKDFFNMDWCKSLVYGSTSIFKKDDETNVYSCNGNVGSKKEFNQQDQIIFDELESRLKGYRTVKEEYPIDRIEHAYLKRDLIGIAFQPSCFLCLYRYVYSPGYKELPPDIEYEITYTPINSNWFRIDQDWN